ncbi:UNVERIFIED_CONTAM: hypothetical protein Sindi_1641900 [Sesamum indicum]
MQARMIQRAQAREERAARERAMRQVAPSPNRAPGHPTPQRPDPDTSATPTAEMQRPETLIEIGSEETHPRDLTLRGPTRGASPSTEMMGSQAGGGGVAGPSRHHKRKHMSPSKSKHGRSHFHGRTEEDEAAARAREDQNLNYLKEIADFESAELTGAMLAPNWRVLDLRTVLNSEAGQDLLSYAILSSPYPRLEQFGAHSLMQCTVLRKRQQEIHQKYRELRNDTRAKERDWDEERQRLNDAKASLEAEVARLKKVEAPHNTEVARAHEEGQRSGFSAGQEAGLVQVRAKGREDIRLEGTRDFLKTPVFDTAGFKKCKAQANKLGAFAEGFDQDRLNPFVDENFQPYVPEPPPEIKGTESASLLDDVEALDE